MDVRDRVFMLTGCASGIGRHLAGALLARGARVFATDFNFEGLETAARENGWDPARMRLARLDVRDAESWRAALRELTTVWGGLDVMMNIAGVTDCARIQDIDLARVELLLAVNTRGMIYGTYFAAQQMIAQGGGGHIINFGSMAALAPVPGLSLYSASKYSIRGFSLAAGQDLAPHKIAVTVICPDAVDTPMLEDEAFADSAAMVFSSARPLTVQDVERAIFERALPRRPREVHIPAALGFLARLATAFPALMQPLGPLFSRRGARHQAAYRDEVAKRRKLR